MAISIQNRRRRPTVASARLKRMSSAICRGLGLGDVELSIVITDDEQMRALNRAWRRRDRPTDVLSFSQVEGRRPSRRVKVLGDVVISADTAARQATQAGVTLEAEVARLLVHGVLHLLGHDHVHGGRQAARMQKEERRLLAVLKGRDA